jgi:peptidyl-prolyl cis-trans isomerase D
MLLNLRNMSRSWAFRGFLLIVAGMMAVTLVQGNPLDMLTSLFRPQGMASVAGGTISAQELNREMELFLRRQRNDGNNVTQAEAVEAGIHMRLLESLIQRRAVVALTRDMGVAASHKQVGDAIRQIPAVQNPLTGAFDRAEYVRFLSEARYSEPEFENEVRGDLSARMLLGALTAGARAPSSFGALVLAYETERRTISIAEAPASLVGNIPAPNAAQIQDFYEDNAAALQVPEYRALTMVFARRADFIARVDVPEQRLREEFEARRAGLTRAETRSFVQLAAPDEARARDAAARLARGEEPSAIATALGLQVVRYDQQPRTGVADPSVAEAVFALRQGAAPAAVRGRLTPWAAVKLEAITPAVAPTFEAERDSLRDAIAADEAETLLNDAVSAFEEARAGGTPVAEAARTSQLSIVTVPAVDAQGLTPTGEPAEALLDQPELVQTAFDTSEGEASDFMPVGDADVIVSVDRIIPATTRPLEEVRAQLTQAWIARERVRRLQEIGDEVIAAVRGGQSFAAAARAHRLTLAVQSRPIDRRSAAQLPARNLAGAIFGARQGEVVSDMRADGGAMLLAVVESIERTSAAEAPQLVEQARMQMQQGISESMTEVITAEAVTRAKPRRNEELIARAFSTGTTDEPQ